MSDKITDKIAGLDRRDPEAAPGWSDRTEQHATGQRGPHREAGDDTVGRGREAAANSPLSPKPQAEREEAAKPAD